MPEINLFSGYCYGSDRVPMTAEDKESMKYQAEKCLKVLGFTKTENVIFVMSKIKSVFIIIFYNLTLHIWLFHKVQSFLQKEKCCHSRPMALTALVTSAIENKTLDVSSNYYTWSPNYIWSCLSVDTSDKTKLNVK